MKTVLMTADAVGGVWRYSIDLGRALRTRGFAPTLAVMGPPPGRAQLDEAARANLPVVYRGFRLEWMPDAGADVRTAGEWLLALADRLGADIVHLNGYAHAVMPWSRPALVVAHSCVRTWWKAVRGEAAPPEWAGYTDQVRAGLRAAGLVVAPSTSMLRALQAEYGAPAAGTVIPNGRPHPGGSDTRVVDKAPLIFSAGRLWDDAKNVTALCTIARDLPWTVCVAGDTGGPDGVAREALAAVRTLGPLTPDEMTRWYRRASVYALPARYEPFGLSVLEAASEACALVLGDIESLREHWNGAALFVPPDDPRALGAAVRLLIDEPELRLRYGRAARERALTFTIDRTTDAYVRAYEAMAA